uniref:Protein DGCR6 n=1 Tax=Zonotrichia albicollis TaxID=44394 RepID=A0A8D2QBZ1_ZONAL
MAKCLACFHPDPGHCPSPSWAAQLSALFKGAVSQQLSRGCSTQPLAAPAQQNLLVAPEEIIPGRCCYQAGEGQAGTGWTDGHNLQSATQSLSSSWDLGILEWKFKALIWGKESNFHSGMFSGYSILLEMLWLKQELFHRHKEAQQCCRPHNLPLLRAAQQREMEAMEQQIREEQRMMDEKIVLELDQKVIDQQSTLEKAGVSGFYITTNPQELTLQMNLLELIRKLQQKEAEAEKTFS